MRLATARRAAGMTQAELARRMGVSQPVVARAEVGANLARIDYVDRVARATGQPITLAFGRSAPTRAELRSRVRRVLGQRRFDPRERDLTPIERRSLDADGL